MDKKTLQLSLILISVISSITLWVTRTEWMNSLSSFALSDNAIFYRLMHISASLFFMVNYIYNKNKDSLYLTFGMSSILLFDMYHFYYIHLIVTILTLAFACYSIIRNNKGFSRINMIFLSVSAIIIFVAGYVSVGFHFLLAEIIAMICIMNGKVLELYKDA